MLAQQTLQAVRGEVARKYEVLLSGVDRGAPLTPAERAGRYRARQRGEDVPHLRSGPIPRTETWLRAENAGLRLEVAKQAVRIAELERDLAVLRAT